MPFCAYFFAKFVESGADSGGVFAESTADSGGVFADSTADSGGVFVESAAESGGVFVESMADSTADSTADFSLDSACSSPKMMQTIPPNPSAMPKYCAVLKCGSKNTKLTSKTPIPPTISQVAYATPTAIWRSVSDIRKYERFISTMSATLPSAPCPALSRAFRMLSPQISSAMADISIAHAHARGDLACIALFVCTAFPLMVNFARIVIFW